MLAFGVELGPPPVPIGLAGRDLGPGLLHAFLLVAAELVGELHEHLVGQDLRLVEDSPLVARALIGPQLGLETEEMRLKQEVAIGILCPQ